MQKKRQAGGNSRLQQRVDEEMADSLDEELEMELDDERLNELLGRLQDQPSGPESTEQSISKSFFACRVSWSNCKTGSCTTS